MVLPVVLSALAPVLIKEILSRTNTVGRPTQTEIELAVANALREAASNPTINNELNGEKFYQSRVFVGSGGTIVGALAVIIPIAAKVVGYDIEEARVMEIGGAILVLGGPLYALYGRFAKGLKPLFSRK